MEDTSEEGVKSCLTEKSREIQSERTIWKRTRTKNRIGIIMRKEMLQKDQ